MYQSIAGLRKLPQGLLLWSILGYSGQYIYHEINDWREQAAQRIRMTRNINQSINNSLSSAAIPTNTQNYNIESSYDSTSSKLNSSSSSSNTIDTNNNDNRLHVPTFSSWLPISNSTEASNNRQKQKLLLRLKEINELLGIEIPPKDPRVTQLDELEKQIIELEKKQIKK